MAYIDTGYWILDTGSNNGLHLFIDSILNMPDIKKQEVIPLIASDLSGNYFHLRQWVVSNLFLSSVKLNNINIVELQPWGKGITDSNELNPEGEVIRLGSFLGKIVSINFLDKNVTFDDTKKPNGRYILNFRLTSSGMLIKGMVKNKKLRFIVDTAATDSVVFYESLPPEVSFESCDQIDKFAKGLDCNVISVNALTTTKNNLNFKAVAMNSTPSEDPGFDGIIGLSFLMKHNITIDMLNNKIYITR
ncbi:hypothetical protein OD635_005248 [Salmonella enterica]|nr:hypothetical protein [Salmonella enterica]